MGINTYQVFFSRNGPYHCKFKKINNKSAVVPIKLVGHELVVILVDRANEKERSLTTVDDLNGT